MSTTKKDPTYHKYPFREELGKFLHEVSMEGTTPTMIRISHRNREYIDKVGEELGLSMNFMINRIIFCERYLEKYRRYYGKVFRRR